MITDFISKKGKAMVILKVRAENHVEKFYLQYHAGQFSHFWREKYTPSMQKKETKVGG